MYNASMNIATFDTYRFIKRLKDAGIDERQAEAEADALSEVLSVNFDKLATKADIKDMATKADIKDMATKADIKDMATKTDLAELKVDMIKYLLAGMLAQSALIVSLIKLT